MTGWTWTTLVIFGTLVFAAFCDLVSEEIRGWLDLVPRAILRLAAARLGPRSRESIYEDEWLPELIYVLHGAESRPITRLIRGTRFALGLVFPARRIGRDRAPAAQVTDASVQQPTQTFQNPYKQGSLIRYTDLSDELPTSAADIKIILTPHHGTTSRGG